MKRKLRYAALAGAFALLVIGAWTFFRQPAVTDFDAGEIQTVDVLLQHWERPTQTAQTADPATIDKLVKVVRTGTEVRDHKCASHGFITLHRSFGRTVQLQFLPGHHDDWYEFRYGGKVYRVPRTEFVAAMRQIGIEAPLVCQ